MLRSQRFCVRSGFMMSVFLSDYQILSLPWHDADIALVKICWSESGELLVLLQVEINPEESLQPMVEVGINASSIELIFHQVWRLKTDFRGDSLPKEVMAGWVIISKSDLLDEVTGHGEQENVRFRHHQIRCTNGSVLNIVFEYVEMKPLYMN